MIINGKSLLELQPIKDMLDHSEICNGLSYGLSESGYDIRCKEDIIIDPSKHNGRFYTASSIEYFQMPNNLLGEVSDKSTWARKGISVKNTKIKPGWRGYLTIEIVYELDDPTIIKAGSSLCQIIFHEMKESIGYNGIYQDQESGPQEGRLYKEEKEEITSPPSKLSEKVFEILNSGYNKGVFKDALLNTITWAKETHNVDLKIPTFIGSAVRDMSSESYKESSDYAYADIIAEFNSEHETDDKTQLDILAFNLAKSSLRYSVSCHGSELTVKHGLDLLKVFYDISRNQLKSWVKDLDGVEIPQDSSLEENSPVLSTISEEVFKRFNLEYSKDPVSKVSSWAKENYNLDLKVPSTVISTLSQQASIPPKEYLSKTDYIYLDVCNGFKSTRAYTDADNPQLNELAFNLAATLLTISASTLGCVFTVKTGLDLLKGFFTSNKQTLEKWAEELDRECPLNSEGLPAKESLEDFILFLQDSEFAPEDYYKEINKVFGERVSKLPLTLINIWNKADDEDILSIVRKCVEAAKEFWLIDPITPLEKIALYATELLASKAIVSSKEKVSYTDCLSFINRRYRSILVTLKSSEAFFPVDEESASEDVLEPSEDDSLIVNIELPVCTDIAVEDKEFERRINYPESILNLFPEDCNILFEEKMKIASEILKDLKYRLSLDLASGNKALMEFLNDKSSTTYIKFLLRFAKTIVDSRLFDSF